MRELVLDTETTGLDPKLGHRLIELAAVELVDRRPTGRNLHLYVNPEREIDVGATQVHGMTLEDLQDKPRFADVAADFLDYARGAAWIIHNAPFDIGFLNAEFALLGLPPCSTVHVALTDTLAMARDAFPGKRNSLDALCERFGVSNAHRTLHGALLDAQLLAEVYLALTRGQESLTIDLGSRGSVADHDLARLHTATDGVRPPLRVIAPAPDELSAHELYLSILDRESKGRCIWYVESRPASPEPVGA